MDKTPYIGPFSLDALVYLKTPDGRIATVTVGCGAGKLITAENIYLAIGQALKAAPEGSRLLDTDEFVSMMIQERTGSRANYAAPTSLHYDVEALTQLSITAREKKHE